MSNGQILASKGENSESGEELLDSLPPWMPTDESSGNFKLLDAVGQSFDRTKGDVRELDKATTVQKAESVEQIVELSKIVKLPPKEGESIEKYRTRSIAEFQSLTTNGTISDLINNSASILGTSRSDISYRELNENGVVNLGLPRSAIDEISITGSEFTEIISKHSAAGFRIEASLKGSFTFMTSSDYSNNNHDATMGYDGLDSNGDPKDSGGTYAGLL